MPRPVIDLNRFRAEIERRIANKEIQAQAQIRGWLASQGMRISEKI
jgi:hypothetical protein